MGILEIQLREPWRIPQSDRLSLQISVIWGHLASNSTLSFGEGCDIVIYIKKYREGGGEGDARGKRYGNILYVYN